MANGHRLAEERAFHFDHPPKMVRRRVSYEMWHTLYEEIDGKTTPEILKIIYRVLDDRRYYGSIRAACYYEDSLTQYLLDRENNEIPTIFAREIYEHQWAIRRERNADRQRRDAQIREAMDMAQQMATDLPIRGIPAIGGNEENEETHF